MTNAKKISDTISIAITNDSLLIKVTDEDTSGYVMDLMTRFCEEHACNYKFYLFNNLPEAIRFSQQKANLLLVLPAVHPKLKQQIFQSTQAFLHRNLPLNKSLFHHLILCTYPSFFLESDIIFTHLTPMLNEDSMTFLQVESVFAANHSDSFLVSLVNTYIQKVEERADIAFLKNYYFGTQLPLSMRKYKTPLLSNGHISPFDDIFIKAAKSSGMDWKMVAAVAFKESRFNPTAVGGGGAFGLMQFMPFVAKKYGISESSTPTDQIYAGTKLLKNMYKLWKSIPSEEQRIKFMLASYNAGQGHVLDAQRLAVKYGMNPLVWDNNVQIMVQNLSLSKYYNDTLVKSGAYHGNAAHYANTVYQIYLSWKTI